MDSKKLALLCRELAENRKGENIVVLDVNKVSSITDYFVIITGTSEPHLRAIFDEITEELKEKHSLTPKTTEGKLDASWIVLDYFDVIVHIMRPDVRELYKLEDLWGDVPRVDGKPGKNPRARKNQTEAPLTKAPKLRAPRARAPKKSADNE